MQAVDKATQDAMMKHYYKKQEEQKKLEEDQDDSYANSDWAASNTLKAHFAGVSNLKIR